jgi:DNA-binding NarL/FixJ family response regulator
VPKNPPPQVLIVDDEPHVRAFISALLRESFSSLSILEAGDDAAALAAMAARPDLVLLDINLIGSSGLDLLPQLLALHPDTVVVMLTAVSVRQAIEQAMARGARGYVLKDGTLEELEAALRDVIRDNFDVDEATGTRS